MNLENYLNGLVREGLLKKEEIGLDQVRAYLKKSRKNLIAAKKILAIDEGIAYTTAYTGMLQLARALVYLNGHRPSDGEQHKTTIDVASKILGHDFVNLIYRFNKMRIKRHKFIYEGTFIYKEEATNAIKAAYIFYNKVKQHLEKTDPQLKLF